jgi:hypothetical protein
MCEAVLSDSVKAAPVGCKVQRQYFVSVGKFYPLSVSPGKHLRGRHDAERDVGVGVVGRFRSVPLEVPQAAAKPSQAASFEEDSGRSTAWRG